jgi:hypothetical protein
MLKITLSKTDLNSFGKYCARSERERRGRWLTKGTQTSGEMNVAYALIIEPTVLGVKREVQCLLKIGILAKCNSTATSAEQLDEVIENTGRTEIWQSAVLA